MAWVSVEKKVIGTVELKEKGVAPVPAPPTPVITSFLDEHRKLKGIIDKHGKGGLCVSRSTLESESKVVGDRLDQHLKIFAAHDVAAGITDEGICGREAIKELKKKLEVEL